MGKSMNEVVIEIENLLDLETAKTRIITALNELESGTIDGSRHRFEVIDRAVNVLTGPHYSDWVLAFEQYNEENGEPDYTWSSD